MKICNPGIAQMLKETFGFISAFTISRVPEAPDCDMGLDSGAYTALESIGPAGTATRNSKLHKKCYSAPESATQRRKVLPSARNAISSAGLKNPALGSGLQ